MQEMFLCFLCTAALLSSSLIVTVKCEKNEMVFPLLQTREKTVQMWSAESSRWGCVSLTALLLTASPSSWEAWW